MVDDEGVTRPGAPETRDSGTSASASGELPLVLGDFRLVEILGAGGMAEVFRAEPLAGDWPSTVVIKRIHGYLGRDPRFVAMFEREAGFASTLMHENVVRMYELRSEPPDVHYIVMEFVDGLTLNRVTRRTWKAKESIPLEFVMCSVADGARGLHYAHTLVGEDGAELKIVHRDVSPENLIIDRQGLTKVLDFGIARGAQSDRYTKTGEIKGKIPFMAPEQLRGELDGRVDIYALGVTAYWMLTGQMPLKAANELQLLNAIATKVPPRARTLNPKIPADVEDVLAAMLEKDPANRPQTAKEVAEIFALDDEVRREVVLPFLEDVRGFPHVEAEDGAFTDGIVPSIPRSVVGLRRTSSLRTLAYRLRRRRRSLGMIAAAAAIGLVLLLGLVWLVSGPSDAPADAGPLPVVADAGAAVAVPVVDAGPPTPPPIENQTVELRAPGRVRWSLEERKLGSGRAAVQLPVGLRAVTALDPRTGGRSTVPIRGGVADFTKLKRGKLNVRALPYATVSVGRSALGPTPFKSAKSLVEGRYRVKLKYKKRVLYRTVNVTAGRTKRITVDFRK